MTSDETLFARVRRSCAAVAEVSTLVRVDPDAIDEYARHIPVADAKAAAAADRATETRDAVDPADVVAHVLAGAAVNFTSGWHDIMRKRPDMSGAVSTVARLDGYIAATGPLTPERLRCITATDASQIFEQELDGGALEELVGLLATTLNELGELAANHGGFIPLVEQAERQASRLATTLGRMPSWNDVAEYRSSNSAAITVSFYKRAQMAIASLHRTFDGEGLGRFDDLDQLTIFADNLVPHVLRLDGVLVYDPALLATINAGELLSPGSAAEIEIRACGVHAAELIAGRLRQMPETSTLRLADLDHWLWSRGGQPRYKAEPRHRCRNRFY